MNQEHSFRIVVTVNGPGEVSGWLFPFSLAMKKLNPRVQVVAALTPSVFSSGNEPKVLESYNSVDEVWPVKQTMSIIRHGRSEKANSLPGCLVHMGGRHRFSLSLNRRLGYVAYAYSETPFWQHKQFKKVYLAHNRALYLPLAARLGLIYNSFGKATSSRYGDKTNSRALVVGNLFVDAAQARCPRTDTTKDNDFTLAFFPGSRPYQARNLVPFFTRVAGDLQELCPDVHMVLAKADFISIEDIGEYASQTHWDEARLKGDRGKIKEFDGKIFLVSERGCRIELLPPEEVVKRARAAITIPGTNTAELAVHGIPMVAVLPTYKKCLSPLPGMLPDLDKIPLAGPPVRSVVAWLFLKTWKHVTHPNIRAGRPVVPELIGRITAQDVKEQAYSLISNNLEALSKELKDVMGVPGAAHVLATEILNEVSLGLTT